MEDARDRASISPRFHVLLHQRISFSLVLLFLATTIGYLCVAVSYPPATSLRWTENIFRWQGIETSVLGNQNSHHQEPPRHPHELIPTLLKLLDDDDDNDKKGSEVVSDSHRLLHALDNPTYDEFQKFYSESLAEPEKDFLGSGNDPSHTIESSDLLHLTLDFNQRMATLSSKSDDDNLKLDDWFALKCVDYAPCESECRESSSTSIVEVGRFRQLPGRYSHQYQWTFAWPSLRFDACYFEWYKVGETPQFARAQRSNFESNGKKRTTMPTDDEKEFVRMGASNAVDLRDQQRRPVGIHWALTHDIASMLVKFTTTSPGTPVVEYHEQSLLTQRRLYQKVTGTSATYSASDMCGAPANETKPGRWFQSSGQLHTVRVTDLRPGTTYQYRVGVSGGQGIGWSDWYVLRTMDQYDWNSDTSSSSESNETQKNMTFLVMGDQGVAGAGPKVTAAAIAQFHPSSPNETIAALHHVGDLSYARGAQHIWDEWLDLLHDNYGTWLPIMVAVGNHEYCTNGVIGSEKDPSGAVEFFHPAWGNFRNDGGGECGVPTVAHFAMPGSDQTPTRATQTATLAANLASIPSRQPSRGLRHFRIPHFHRHHHNSPKTNHHPGNRYQEDKDAPDGAPNPPFWYSYSMGLVYTIVLSSEHDLSPGSRQHAFLRQELAAIQDDRRDSKLSWKTFPPWVIVELHRPLYYAAAWWDQNAVGVAMRYEMEDLLVLDYPHIVDVVFSGHYHSYFRTCDGLYASQCHRGGPTHITVGTGGAPLEYHSLYEAPWTARHIVGEFGYGKVTVLNATDLLFEFVGVKGDDDNTNNATQQQQRSRSLSDSHHPTTQVLDSVWLHRDRSFL